MATKGAVAARRELALKSIGESADRLKSALNVPLPNADMPVRYNANPDFANMLQTERLAEYLASVADKVEEAMKQAQPVEPADGQASKLPGRPKRKEPAS